LRGDLGGVDVFRGDIAAIDGVGILPVDERNVVEMG
jgi:hypothetical protein